MNSSNRIKVPFLLRVLLVFVGAFTIGCLPADKIVDAPPSSPDNKSNLPDTFDSKPTQDQSHGSSSIENRARVSEGSAHSEKIAVEIVVEGAEVGVGPLRVAVYDNPKTFNKVDLAKWKDVFESNGKPITIELDKSLFPNNEMAVAVYQDNNSNNQLDKNAFGIPQESYGFSNNPKRGFGPPKYMEVVIPMPAEKLSMTIQLQ